MSYIAQFTMMNHRFLYKKGSSGNVPLIYHFQLTLTVLDYSDQYNTH